MFVWLFFFFTIVEGVGYTPRKLKIYDLDKKDGDEKKMTNRKQTTCGGSVWRRILRRSAGVRAASCSRAQASDQRGRGRGVFLKRIASERTRAPRFSTIGTIGASAARKKKGLAEAQRMIRDANASDGKVGRAKCLSEIEFLRLVTRKSYGGISFRIRTE